MTDPGGAPAEEQLELVKNDDEGQYELHRNGERVALATYLERDGVVVLPHTETNPAFGGRGYAARLVRFALDDIRQSGRRVDPACPFVADFMDKHTEYAELRQRA